MGSPDTVITVPTRTAAIWSGSLVLSKKARMPWLPLCRYTFFPLR
jgi:hypothetical protein